MGKSLYIGMVMCLLSGWTARAQRTVDLDFRQVTLNVVFDAIERQTGVPVITSKNAAQLNQVVTNLIEATDEIASKAKSKE